MFNDYGSSSNIGSFNEQSHTVGPFVSTPIADKLSLYGGAQFGISNAAPDTELRLWITQAF